MLTAFGDTIDPSELNEWMKCRKEKQGGFVGSLVNWYAMEKHGNVCRIHYEPNDYWHDISHANDASILDSYLNDCKLVIVQVYNEKSRGTGQHWVLVPGKKNGEYMIVDPGDRNETRLRDYKENKILEICCCEQEELE